MANDKFYIPGSFYRICDRSGFKFRAERTKKEWNGLIVADRFWEARQPQDLVQGVRDEQAVPDPRPRQKDQFLVTGSYVVSPAAAGATAVIVKDAAGFRSGNTIQVMLDSGDGFLTSVAGVAGAQISLAGPLPGKTGSYGEDNSVVVLPLGAV